MKLYKQITLLIEYAIEKLMINCNCFNYQTILNVEPHRSYVINDLILLMLLLNYNGQIPDFTMYTTITENLLQFTLNDENKMC